MKADRMRTLAEFGGSLRPASSLRGSLKTHSFQGGCRPFPRGNPDMIRTFPLSGLAPCAPAPHHRDHRHTTRSATGAPRKRITLSLNQKSKIVIRQSPPSSLPTNLNAVRCQIVAGTTCSSPWWGQSVPTFHPRSPHSSFSPIHTPAQRGFWC
jgi:hypothetical protein